jgi:hypothetical protein
MVSLWLSSLGGKPTAADFGIFHSIPKHETCRAVVFDMALTGHTVVLTSVGWVTVHLLLAAQSVGMETASVDLAVRVLRNPVADGSGQFGRPGLAFC